ncbi:uncharacterized protein LOC143208702 [Lasioglossum baleicum]|uniref:uncharacterized protein LOC143208702 n=1 Tax=Lasioglossum baleicum TaxID=434251 RepID=UPI003FCCD455
MAVELHKHLISYFSQLEKVDCKWKELSEEAKRPLQALKNQLEQLRLVTSEGVDNADFCKTDEIHGRLIYKILIGIDNEIALLLDISNRFNHANQNLRSRYKNLEEARSKVSLNDDAMKELVNGTPYRPRLNLLLEWAMDGLNYYHNLYLRISGNINQYNFKNEEIMEDLTNSFVEDRFKRERIDQILGFTQFLIKETAR